MEIDYPTQPAAIASLHTERDKLLTALIDGVSSLDDFLATHQADFDARVAASEEAKSPPAKEPKTITASTLPQPVAVGARSSKYTILLHEQCQALAIPQPVFTYTGDSLIRWAVEVSFPGLANADELQGLREESRFNSKQEAKEAASKTALSILEDLVQTGRVTKAGKAKKQKDELAQHQLQEKDEPSENFVGQLLEFQRSTSAPQPTYTDYQVGTRWACLMQLEGYDQPFGSLDALFGTKKLARQHAAGRAVAHFKSLRLWPSGSTGVGGIKKRRLVANPASSPSSPADSHRFGDYTTAGAEGGSAVSQVASLAHRLGLNTPEYRFAYADSSVPDLHSVSCYFKNGGAHEGPIGEVRNVFGKKKAREECGRLTLAYLTKVKSQREDMARRLIEGAGMALTEDDRMAHSERNKDASDDELDIYEDAPEY